MFFYDLSFVEKFSDRICRIASSRFLQSQFEKHHFAIREMHFLGQCCSYILKIKNTTHEAHQGC